MYEALYRYFIQHKKLYLPGIGIFSLQRKPAEADFINKCIHPPVYSVALLAGEAAPSSKFFSWLAAASGISEKEAIIRFNDFIFELKRDIGNGAKIEWQGMGTITKGLGGEIKFQAEPVLSLPPVPAEKIIRDKAEHTVLVGESEKTSAEMTEYFSNTETKKMQWWILPLSAAILALMFIGWHLSENGIQTSSSGNIQKVKNSVQTETYTELK